MNYRLIRSVKKGSMFGRRAAVLLAFAALVAVFQWLFPSALREGVHEGGSLIIGASRSFATGVGNFFSVFRDKEALVSRIGALEEERAKEELARADYEALVKERDLLLSLGLREGKSPRLLAAVLSVPPESPYDMLLLDAGAREGVSEGSNVFSGSVLIGRIARVEERQSVAELFSSPGRETSVVLLHGGEPIRVTATGEGGGAFLAVLPREVSVLTGDPVFLPGTPLSFFGTVASVEAEEHDVFKRVRFGNPVPLRRHLFVFIQSEKIQP